MKQKKIPERKCTGCGQKAPKSDLIRIVRTPEGEIVTDTTGKVNGRGAYLCKKLSCLKKAQKANRFEKALESEIPDEIYEKLASELES